MDWCIREDGFDEKKIEFLGNKMCIGNGYFGYRGTLEEYGREQLTACTVSEIFDDNGNGWREPVNVPNGLFTCAEYAGEKLSVLDAQVESHVQELYIDTGTHRRKTVFVAGDGSRITVEAERFASLSDLHILAMRYQVTERMQNATDIHASLKKGVPFIMEKYTAICKETDCPDVWESAVRCCSESASKGFDELKEEQRRIWGERYSRLGIEIKGDEEAQQAVLYSAYLLYSSAPIHTDRVAIPARGLSGQVYKGAMFWDTEIYMLPMFAFCEPKIARNLVMYRVRNLEGARAKAAEYGYRGAFYPWESQENGKDGCTLYNLTDIFTGRKIRTYFRDKQIHISADVAYGLWKYMEVTGDREILLDGAAEVILECARFFYSYAYYKKDKGRFEFLDVTGADEYHERVNNDAYTNYMIWLTAKAALDVLDQLKREHPDKYEELMTELDYREEEEHIRDLYENIYLPEPGANMVIEQFDGYLKGEDLSLEELYSRIIKPNEYLGSPTGLTVNTQIIKQADVVLLMSLLGDLFTKKIKEKNWEYYEPRTEHGSSLSTCIYALLSAQIGKTEWAYKYLMKAARIDLTGDYKLYLGARYIGGTHPAANGGTWRVVVQGFAGLDIRDGGIKIDPHLPEKWEELKFGFGYSGSRYRAAVRKEEIEIRCESLESTELKVTCRGNVYHCVPGQVLRIKY